MTISTGMKSWSSKTMVENIFPLGLGLCVLGGVGDKESVDLVD